MADDALARIVAETLRESPRLPTNYADLGDSEKKLLVYRARREGTNPVTLYERAKAEQVEALQKLDRHDELEAIASAVRNTN